MACTKCTTAIAFLIVVISVSSSLVISCPTECSCPTGTTEVDCTGTRPRLTSIPQNVPESTTTLNLDNNAIADIPADAFQKLPNLINLRLSDNEIASIALGLFRMLGRLEELYLDGNAISYIANDTFEGLRDLKILSLTKNGLSSLEIGSFHELQNLEDLYIDDNQITHIPPGTFARVSNLKILSLADNKLTNIEPGLFDELQILERLFLNINDISSISAKTFTRLTNLKILSLSHNRIALLKPGLLQELLSLEDLYLDNNDITIITNTNDTFTRLTKMKILSLAENKFTTIPPGLFSDNRILEQLFLNGNNISFIANKTFAELDNIRSLRLDGNELTTLPQDVFPSSSEELDIDFSNNQWHCDCALRWLQRLPQASEIRCHTPSAHSAKLLNGIDELACLPVIQTDESEIHLVVTTPGKWVEMPCPAVGDPSPTVSWTATVDVGNQAMTSASISHPNGSLIIARVVQSDSGDYSCMVTNSAGSVLLVYHVGVDGNIILQRHPPLTYLS